MSLLMYVLLLCVCVYVVLFNEFPDVERTSLLIHTNIKKHMFVVTHAVRSCF